MPSFIEACMAAWEPGAASMQADGRVMSGSGVGHSERSPKIGEATASKGSHKEMVSLDNLPCLAAGYTCVANPSWKTLLYCECAENVRYKH